MFETLTQAAIVPTASAVVGLLMRLGLDLAAMCTLIFALFYRRYRDKELATAAALFNIFVFSVLSVLSSVNFGVAAGFGLFAILALFTLRSEPLSKVEMTYFFGSVAIAVICSVQGTTLGMTALILALLLIGAYIIDHPRVLHSVGTAKISLDKIDPALLGDSVKMRDMLSERLGVEILNYQVLQIDYVSELVRLNVYFRTR